MSKCAIVQVQLNPFETPRGIFHSILTVRHSKPPSERILDYQIMRQGLISLNRKGTIELLVDMSKVFAL
jgi:hypothetical protein